MAHDCARRFLGGIANPGRCYIGDGDRSMPSSSEALNPKDTRNRIHINARADLLQFADLCFIVFQTSNVQTSKNCLIFHFCVIQNISYFVFRFCTMVEYIIGYTSSSVFRNFKLYTSFLTFFFSKNELHIGYHWTPPPRFKTWPSFSWEKFKTWLSVTKFRKFKTRKKKGTTSETSGSVQERWVGIGQRRVDDFKLCHTFMQHENSLPFQSSTGDVEDEIWRSEKYDKHFSNFTGTQS
jgi:hypothetical protein